LIHISELSDHRINHPKEVVKEGDVVTLRIIKIDPERRRIGLSLRKVDSMAYANLDYEMMLAGQAKPMPEAAQEKTPEQADEQPVSETPAVEEPMEVEQPPVEPADQAEQPSVEPADQAEQLSSEPADQVSAK